MKKNKNNSTYLWLALYALISFFIIGRWGNFLAIWLAPIFGLKFYRSSGKGGRAFLLLWMATVIPSLFVLRGVTIFSFYFPLVEAMIVLVSSAVMMLPYMIDRLFNRRWTNQESHSFLLTLIFPVAVTALEYISYGSSPIGSFGALAYSQADFLPFIQFVSIGGLWGITFMFSWFPSVVNYVWENKFDRRKSGKGVIVFATILILVMSFGSIRMIIGDTESQTVRVGGFSLPREVASSMYELWNDNNHEAYRQGFKKLNEAHLDKIGQMADQGAKIVSLQEGAIQGFEEDVNMISQKASILAKEKGIYIVMPMAVKVQDGKDHNYVNVYDPSGDVVLTHYKFGGAFLEGSVAGSETLQYFDTPYGKMSVVICWDGDFPAIIQQAGREQVDLMFIPSNDWFEYKDIHADMTRYRSIENGMPIFRQTGSGSSQVTDAYGQLVNHIDMYEEEGKTEWANVQVVDVPVGSVNTLYPMIGEVFGMSISVALMGLLVFAWMRRKS